MKKHLEKFKSLEKGKKIKLIIVIIVLLIIIYLLAGLFSSSSNNYAPIPPAANTSANVKTPVVQAQQVPVVQKQTIEKSNTVTNNLNAKQTAYLAAVNELQMLQLKQQIAQTKQQIAQAELQAAQSNKQLQLLTTPLPSPPPASIFNNQASVQQAPQIPTAAYQLAYVANEGGKWQVIINNNGNLINATLGSTLPDGSMITNISGTSVTLSKNGQNNILTIAASF